MSTETYGRVKGSEYSYTVLPWGSIEPHNYHLPYMTDSILSQSIALDAVDRAWKDYGVTGAVLPPIWLGSQNPGQIDLPFCIHTRYETQKMILSDIVKSLYHQGMKKLVIMSGHGGNIFKPMIRDLSMDYPDMLIIVCEWFAIVPRRDYFGEEIDDHAGEQESSVMRYYPNKLVNLEDAGE